MSFLIEIYILLCHVRWLSLSLGIPRCPEAEVGVTGSEVASILKVGVPEHPKLKIKNNESDEIKLSKKD
jgi:hypothetical protein